MVLDVDDWQAVGPPAKAGHSHDPRSFALEVTGHLDRRQGAVFALGGHRSLEDDRRRADAFLQRNWRGDEFLRRWLAGMGGVGGESEGKNQYHNTCKEKTYGESNF